MQCGTPVICSNAASLPEVVGDAGLLLAPADHDAWCNAILRVARDAQLQQDLRCRSLERASHFSWDITTDLTVSAYGVAIEQSRRGA
jgi:glycosyltransferase involved in cell wall biosynthesis